MRTSASTLCYSIFALDGDPGAGPRAVIERLPARSWTTTHSIDVPDAGNGVIGATPPELAVVVVVLDDELVIGAAVGSAECRSVR